MKNIPEYPKYSINEDGTKIYNNKTKRFLRAYNSGKHIYVSIISDIGEYKSKPCGVHRLVSLTYLAVPEKEKRRINHKDGNKYNNHFSNLEWVTISENIQCVNDSRNRVVLRGEDHWRYGVKVGKVTKNRMSVKKRGELHPKFAGWYIVNGER